MAEITIKIELGNGAMLRPSDVAAALEDMSADMRQEALDDTFTHPLNERIYDANGNTVGSLTLDTPPHLTCNCGFAAPASPEDLVLDGCLCPECGDHELGY